MRQVVAVVVAFVVALASAGLVMLALRSPDEGPPPSPVHVAPKLPEPASSAPPAQGPSAADLAAHEESKRRAQARIDAEAAAAARAPVEPDAAATPLAPSATPGMRWAARVGYETIPQLLDKKSAVARWLAPRAPVDTFKLLREQPSDEERLRQMLAMALAPTQPWQRELIALNFFGLIGVELVRLPAGDPRFRTFGGLTKADVADAPFYETDPPWVELWDVDMRQGWGGVDISGIAANVSDQPSGSIAIKFEFRDADDVIIGTAYETRYEGLAGGDRWRFKATAFDAKLGPGVSFDIEIK